MKSKEIGDTLARHKQILVLEDQKLASASILSLLMSKPELNVINTTFSSLASLDLLDEGLQPDVVILAEELLAANISAVVKLADRHPKLRLIVFSLSSNTLNVFDKQRVQVMQVSDFLELL